MIRGMKPVSTRRCAVLVLIVLLAWSVPAFAQADAPPILVQGAMQIEVEQLAGRLEHATIEQTAGWTFWRGTIDGYPVVVSKTLRGMSNAAAATVLAIDRYHPLAIINQGTAGGHDPSLHVYDIVVGAVAVNVGAFRSPFRPAGAGSSTLDWTPIDLTSPEGSVATADPSKRRPASFSGDPALLADARRAMPQYGRGRVVEGVIGSSDVWNDEIDRVARLHTQYGTLVEEMETASAAQIAQLFHVPFVGIRVLSDNITNGGAYDPRTSEACEAFVYAVVKAHIAGLRK